MIAENVQRVIRERTGADVEYAGREFARDLVHVGDHQQQALAGGKRRRQSARHQRTVHRARGAGFRFHFRQTKHLTEQVLSALGRPLVTVLRHRGRRCDRVDCGDFAERICDMRGGGVAVDSHFFAHYITSVVYILMRRAPYAGYDVAVFYYNIIALFRQ